MGQLGYVRVSTKDQNLDMQMEELEAAGVDRDHIFQDKASGGTMDRPGLKKLLAFVRKGDTIVVWKLDRLSRCTRDTINLVEDLALKNVYFKSLTEPIDTSNELASKLVLAIFSVIAENERYNIRQRVMRGLESAKKKGRIGGRPYRLDNGRKQSVKTLFESGTNMTEIAKTFSISRKTVYNYLKEMKLIAQTVEVM
jgi:DNA invertase Pin-like site-specific DNA recombinase